MKINNSRLDRRKEDFPEGGGVEAGARGIREPYDQRRIVHKLAVIRLPYADCEFFANFLQAKLLFHGFSHEGSEMKASRRSLDWRSNASREWRG
jgi:hypothetical protein